MKILVASAKAEFYKLDEICRELKALLGDKAEVVRADEINWERWKAETGSWDGAYALAGKTFDRLVLTETEAKGVGRGQFELWKQFVGREKKVSIIRHGMNKPEALDRLSLSKEGDWKMKYAVVS